jgi:serine/threonine protein kinase
LGRLGPYRILGVLGTGAMGVVFQAEDPGLRRLVALKVMKPSLAASTEYHRRFLREAQLAAAIDHENIVTVYQVGEDRGVPFLAMKLLQGETLEDCLGRVGGRLPPAEVMRIGRETAEGLAAAHARGLVHRDIKPANIWLEAGRGRVKIVDFGLARGGTEDAQFTQAGAVIGTPAYMAPEQANAAEVDARSDLFSLGTVLYRAVTGELPFGGKDTLSVLKALATKTPTPPHQLVPSVPPPFSALVMRLLAKEPGQRPRSAREVVQAIAAIERGDAAPVAFPSEEAPAGRERKRERAAPPPAEEVREKEAPGSGVKRKGPKKARAARRKDRPAAGWDWGRWVLVASLVLLAVAILVLIIALIRHAGKARAAAREGGRSLAKVGMVFMGCAAYPVNRKGKSAHHGLP